MKRFWANFWSAVAMSFFVFPVGFTFLPESLSSKILIAGLGLVVFLYRCYINHRIEIPRYILISGILASCFSLWCLYSVTSAGTYEMIYVHYMKSFFTWILGAYGACVVMQWCTGKNDLPSLTRYLAIMSVAQCVIAILIDNVAFISSLADRIFRTGSSFYKAGGRLYGIGCALDVAGVRFAAILLLIAHQIVRNPEVGKRSKAIASLLTGFLIITVVGSMISRTTSVGAGLGLAYMAIANSSLRRGGFISSNQVRVFLVSFVVILFVVMTSVYLYNSSGFFHENVRFGFEGFFNWVETGEFRTGSTDHLQTMWVWPTTQREWIIGKGVIGVLNIGSDIGYCNFVSYCGLIGMTLISVYFIYNHLCLNGKFESFVILSLLMVALTFIIWTKVLTDIFFIDALLFCVAGEKELGENGGIPMASTENED